MSDMAHVITSEIPLVRASTPNEIAISPVVAANVSAARQGLVVIAVATGAMVPVRSPSMRSSAHLAVLGARIRTLDPAQPWATAVAMRAGTIVAVGDDASVRAACDASTEVLDGRGISLVPGLVDSHQHPLMGADHTAGADLAGLSTLEEVRAALAVERARCSPGEWVQGHSLEYATFDGVELSGELVADAVGGAPAYLTFFDFHTVLVTPAALAAAGVDSPRPLEGSAEVVCRNGRPTGVLLEPAAYALVQRAMPQPTPERRRARRAEGLRRMAATGLTAVHGMDGSPATHDELREFEARGELCLRIVSPLDVSPEMPWEELERRSHLRSEAGLRWRGGVAKFFIDGVVEPGTAWLEEPDSEGRGLQPLWPDPERYARAVSLFARAGFQCATHAIGDRGVRCALDAYRAAGAAPGVRHRVEHIETLGDAQLARFAAEGVAAAMQPIHLQWMRADLSDPWSRALGPERAARAFRCADLVASGALLALGSDWPVAHYDPRAGMAWARLRRPPGEPSRAAVVPEQALSAEQALRGYTSEAWRAVGEERHAGRIAVGMRADLTGFAADPAECPADELPDLPVLLTVVAGEPVARR
jgi:predicted amidohydrolase YtcJ